MATPSVRLAALLAILWPAAAAAQPGYSIQDLGTLGGDISVPIAVNAQGHVAGSAATSTHRLHAFFHAGVAMQDLGTLGGEESFANGLNDLDDVVGRSFMPDGSVHAFIYDGATHTLADLHPLLAPVFGGVDSSALAINNLRRIAGGAMMPDGSVHAFLLDLVTGSVQDLHAFVSLGGPNSKAFALSDSGRVAGISDDPTGNPQAFVYDAGTGVVIQLGTLGGDMSDAQAINIIGQVVGAAGLSALDTFHAYLSDGQAALGAGDDAGTLGGSVSVADGLNDLGAVVGTAFDANGRVFATLYDRTNGMRDLEMLLDSNPGWVLVEAAAINAGGVIVGTGFINGARRAFVMTRAPTTTQIVVDTSPSGLAIVVDGVSDTAPKTYQWAANSEHQLSTTEPQQETAGSRLMFSSWSDGGALTHTLTTPSSATTHTATFKTQYRLTTAANPPAGGSITPGGWFDAGTNVDISATPAAGFGFTGFSGDLSGTVNPSNVTMDAARSVTANFKGLTATSVGTSPNPSPFGQTVSMTATVTASAGIPGGSVSFYDGATNIGTQLLDGSGSATQTAALTGGSHTITAAYAGNSSFLASTSAPVTQTVNKAPTSTSVSSSKNPAVAGQTVTFTAVVASAAGVPSGTVTFKDGAVALGTGALNASGHATFTTSTLAAGTHPITAEYGGDTNFLRSSSPAVSQTVTKTTTTTTLTSAPNPSLAGQAVTFTATVTSPTGGIPTGTVTFKDGNAVLGSSALGAGGTAVFNTSSLSVATHTIKAVYAGTASYAGSTSANLKQVVTRAPTTTSLTSSPNPSTFGQMVTFTATVTASGTPTGTVTFKDGGKSLGRATLSAGQAIFSTSSLKRGSHSITATYSGDSHFASSVSTPTTQVVN